MAISSSSTSSRGSRETPHRSGRFSPHQPPQREDLAMSRPAPATVDDYIATFPPHIQPILQQVRQSIRSTAPEAGETISSGMPTFDLPGKHLVFFAGWKRQVSVYPLPAGDAAFQEEISRYKRAKGSIQFPFRAGGPYDLVERIVGLLVAEKPEAGR